MQDTGSAEAPAPAVSDPSASTAPEVTAGEAPAAPQGEGSGPAPMAAAPAPALPAAPAMEAAVGLEAPDAGPAQTAPSPAEAGPASPAGEGDPAAPVAGPEAPSAPAGGAAAPGMEAPALRHAQDFTAREGWALVALVLMAADEAEAAGVVDLRLPVAVGLRPGPLTDEAAAAHAASGHELVLRLDGPIDAAAAVAAAEAMPASTAVFAPDAAGAGLAPALIPRGVGLLTGPGARQKLPRGAAPSFAILPAGATAAEVARVLDQAGMEATPGFGTVIVLPAEPAAVGAFLDWRMRAPPGLVLAPLSALLLEPR